MKLGRPSCLPRLHACPRDVCGNPISPWCLYCGEHVRTTRWKAFWDRIRNAITGGPQ